MIDDEGRSWRPCMQVGRKCESCDTVIERGAPVYFGFVCDLFWCAPCTKKRINREPPSDYATPRMPAKLRMAKADAPGFRRLGEIGKAVSAEKDWAMRAAGDDTESL